MEFFHRRTHIDFMAQRKWAALLSAMLFALSLLSIAINGLNMGLDFTGGSQLEFSFPDAVDAGVVRDTLEKNGFSDAVVISYGNSRDVLITLPLIKQPKDSSRKEDIAPSVQRLFPGAKLEQSDFIGPQVGQELATKGILAVVIALLGTMIYIALRFEFRFAIGSTVALIHDPIIILGIFSFLHLEFNLIVLAGILTVIGYSLNDTIVIFDRVRENFRKLRKATPLEVINEATNQTLSRTLMTSALTLVVVLALFFLGGNMLHGFALALIIGIVVGTYSSIYVAGSLSLYLGLKRQHLLPPPKEQMDSRP